MGARVLLGVSGSIAAYRAVELARLLQQSGCEVTVLQTRASQDFVGSATFAALTRRPVITDESGAGGEFPHLDAGRNAQILVVAPATAATIARMAAGQADDVLSSTYLAFEGPVVVAPAMNVRMWQHPATVRNLARLRGDGVQVVEPQEGLLACGDVGAGRLATVEEIAARVQRASVVGLEHRQDLQDRTIVVTAGGTREPIDEVRAITNRSSGRMGVELARAAAARGARVRLITTVTVDRQLHTDLEPVAVVERAADLEAALHRELPGADALVMAAAVSDFTVAATPGKLERGDELQLLLRPVPDLIAQVARSRESDGPLLVGFAAESGDGGLERARAKLHRKGIDLIVHNDISRADSGFESDTNEVTVLGSGVERHVGPAHKREIADTILDELVAALARPRSLQLTDG